MSDLLKTEQENRWFRIHCLFGFLLFLYFLVERFCITTPIIELANYYRVTLTALFTLYFFMRGLRDEREIRLMLYYWIWLLVSRVLNGDFSLFQDFSLVFDMGFCVLSLGTCALLNKAWRRRFLNLLSIAVGGFYTLLAILGIVAEGFQICITLPMNGEYLAFIQANTFSRLMLLYRNPNICAMWMLMAMCLMAYQFFTCRRKLWRIPLVLAFVLQFTALGLTYSRNTKIAAGVALALTAMVLLLRLIPERKRMATALAIVLCCGIVPLTYVAFDGTTAAAFHLCRAIEESAKPAETTEPVEVVEASEESAPEQMETPPPVEPTPKPIEELSTDTRVLGESLTELSGRRKIYSSVIPTLTREPLRLLRGSLERNVMTISTEVIGKSYAHFHNFILQTLVLTGIPGLILMLAFCVLLAIRMLRVFFSRSAPLEAKLLIAPLAAFFSYDMLEACIFTQTDARALYFFLIAGVFLAWSYEWERERV